MCEELLQNLGLFKDLDSNTNHICFYASDIVLCRKLC